MGCNWLVKNGFGKVFEKLTRAKSLPLRILCLLSYANFSTLEIFKHIQMGSLTTLVEVLDWLVKYDLVGYIKGRQNRKIYFLTKRGKAIVQALSNFRREISVIKTKSLTEHMGG